MNVKQEMLGVTTGAEIIGSNLDKVVNATVIRELESWRAHIMKGGRYARCFSERGLHYIFKMFKNVEPEGKIMMLHTEVKTSDASQLYAAAKVNQLEEYDVVNGAYCTGGETIGDIRRMLSFKAGMDAAKDFYPEYADTVSVAEINDESAKWLRDSYGIAPWYGALKIPYSISVCGKKGVKRTVTGYMVTGFSGCENDQEDLFYNVQLTRMILQAFADNWGQDVIRLDLNKLIANPVLDMVFSWMSVPEIFLPKAD